MSLTLEFSHNWNNKLHCKAFTTLRMSDRFSIGDQVEIYLKNRRMGIGTIVNKIKMKLGSITDSVAYLDTGYNAIECRKIIQKKYNNQILHNDVNIYLYIIVQANPPQELPQPQLFSNDPA